MITLKYDLYVFKKIILLKINYYIEHFKRVAAENTDICEL